MKYEMNHKFYQILSGLSQLFGSGNASCLVSKTTNASELKKPVVVLVEGQGGILP